MTPDERKAARRRRARARLIVISILLIISVLSTSMFISTSVNKNKTQQELNQRKAQLENKEDYQSLYYSAKMCIRDRLYTDVLVLYNLSG